MILKKINTYTEKYILKSGNERFNLIFDPSDSTNEQSIKIEMKRQILQRNPKWTYKAGNKDPIIVQAIIYSVKYLYWNKFQWWIQNSIFFQRATLWNLIDIVVSEKRIGRIFVGFKSMIESVLTPPFISMSFWRNTKF